MKKKNAGELSFEFTMMNMKHLSPQNITGKLTLRGVMSHDNMVSRDIRSFFP